MELLAGESRPDRLLRLERALSSFSLLSVDPAVDFHDAAILFRATRRNGNTVRKLLGCVIAAVALRNDAVLVHDDRDFVAIAECVPLKTLR